jgi:hypothetical protein
MPARFASSELVIDFDFRKALILSPICTFAPCAFIVARPRVFVNLSQQYFSAEPLILFLTRLSLYAIIIAKGDNSMSAYNETSESLDALKQRLQAWAEHIEALNLGRRTAFVAWLAGSFSPREFALLLDAEVDRGSLWETYLNERFGLEANEGKTCWNGCPCARTWRK